MDKMENLIVRKANRHDTDAITRFNILGSEETVNKAISVEDVRAGVSVVLRSNQDFYLVATYENNYVGQCKIHYHWYDWYDASFWWIEHLYVAKQYRRKGIGSMMLKEVSRLAKENGFVKGVLLHVHKNNHPAITAYEKSGFDIHENKLMYSDIIDSIT